MFHSGKSPPTPRNVRLPKQGAMPSYGDIQFLMQEANKIMGRWVELPFSGKDKKQELILAVKYEKDVDVAADPNWTLFQVTSAGQSTVWQYATRDLTLICNLVMTASGADTLEDVIPASAILGKAGESHLSGAGGSTQSSATASGGIVFEPPRPGAKATLEGDLKNLQVPNLLQSINLAKMTGKLDVRSLSENAEVYFQDGIPMHASVKDVSGDQALVELITWAFGEFRFWPDEISHDRTVLKRLDSMLMEGVALLDQTKYLETAGLKRESCLVKKNAMISEEEFRARVEKGAPIGLEGQLDFYELIDNRNTLSELLRNRPMPKVEYIPIIFNLVSCGLVQITDQAPQQNRLATLKSLGIDEAAVQGVLKNLLRPETGILTYPAFIYLLDQEYLRYEYFNTPFSLLVFSIGQRKQEGNVEALQMLAVRRAMQRISLVKRQIDMLGHYETFDYAMILPNTNSTAASALANRIADVLREAPLSSDMDSRSLALAFGVATVPEDCQELDKVLLAARKARDKAKFTQQRVCLAREIINQPGGLAAPT
jgi:GGDEF domain-containing protein